MFGKTLARFTLRHLPEREQRHRLLQFNSAVLSRLLLLLYIVYPGTKRGEASEAVPGRARTQGKSRGDPPRPLTSRPPRTGVSVSIFGIFSCTTFESGRSFLDADFTITCYDQTHWNYIGAAIIWLFVVTLGIPAYFIWLLRRFKVPELVELISNNCWLREAVELAWTEGMPQPTVVVAEINCDTIEDLHLEALYAFFCHSVTVDEAGEILNGKRAPIEDDEGKDKHAHEESQEKTVLQAKLEAVKDRAMSAVARARAAQNRLRHALKQKCMPQSLSQPSTPVAAVVKTRREHTLEALLAWCKTSGELSIPKLVWEELPEGTHEEMLAEEATNAAPQAPGPIRCSDITRLQRRAMSQVGFLFAAYRMECWYWCVPCAPADSPSLCAHACTARSQGGC